MSTQSTGTDRRYPIVDLVTMILREAVGLSVRRINVMLLEDRIQVSYDGKDQDAPPRRLFSEVFGCLWLYSCTASRLKLFGEFLTASGEGIGYQINLLSDQDRDLARELTTLSGRVRATLDEL